MDSALRTAYQTTAPIKATMVRVDLSSGAVGFTDGGFVVYDGLTYYGDHPTYGILSSVSPIADGTEATTTRIELSLLPRDDAAVLALSGYEEQGARVRWWEGVVGANGVLVGEPELKFDGEIDKPKFTVGASWGLTLECGTQAERQVEANADWRWNHPFHSLIWPSETGMIYVTKVRRKIYWRKDGGSSISSGGGTSLNRSFNPAGNLVSSV